MLKGMGERTPPCGTPDLNCRFVDVWVPECCVCHASLDVGLRCILVWCVVCSSV